MLETSQTNFGGTNISESILNENRGTEAQSVCSSRPILINQSQAHDLNDTIMIDDVVSTYSITQRPLPKKSSKQKSAEAFDLSLDEKIRIRSNSDSLKQETNIDYHEPHTDELYSFRISSNHPPPEPFDPNAPIEQYNYTYNGVLNRPAFEIISHADIRPATPIKFEQARDLSIKRPRLTRNHSDEFETKGHKNDYLYSERIYSRCSRSPSRSPRRRGRSFTTPVKLNYGYQGSIKSTGKPVEWQMARELRTTDWDRLKRCTDNSLHSFYDPSNTSDCGKYYSINELDNETSRYYNSRNKSNLNNKLTHSYTTTVTSEYSVPKRKIDLPPSTSNLRRDSSREDNKGSFMRSSYAGNPHNNNNDDEEQSKPKLSNYDNKYLLDYISSNSSDISSYQNKLNLYKSKLIDNSNQILNKKSDFDENGLYEDKWRADRRGHTTNDHERKSDSIASSQPKESSKSTILTRIIRDPDTNEILSKTRINESDISDHTKLVNNQPDRNNVSIIDVTYNNSQTISPKLFGSRKSSSNTDLPSPTPITPPLPPPPQFLPDTFSTSTNKSRKFSDNRLSPILSKNSSSTNSDKSSNGTITRHANEDFQPSEVLNVNETIYQSKLDSPQLAPKNSNLNSFSEQSKRILDKIPSKTSPPNLFSEIQTFNPTGLRSVKTKVSDPFIYDKINDSSSNRSSSVFSTNNNNNNATDAATVKSPIQSVGSSSSNNENRKTSSNEDKNSLASSTIKRITNMY